MRRTKLPDIEAYETKMYRAMQGMIKQHVLKACKRSCVPYEEMKAQADYIFSYALRRFDDRKGVKFSTFLHLVLHNGLIDFGQLESYINNGVCDISWMTEETDEYDALNLLPDGTQVRKYIIADEISALQGDHKELADMALAGLASTLRDLGKIAIKRLGWTEERFVIACLGLKEIVMAW